MGPQCWAGPLPRGPAQTPLIKSNQRLTMPPMRPLKGWSFKGIIQCGCLMCEVTRTLTQGRLFEGINAGVLSHANIDARAAVRRHGMFPVCQVVEALIKNK